MKNAREAADRSAWARRPRIVQAQVIERIRSAAARKIRMAHGLLCS